MIPDKIFFIFNKLDSLKINSSVFSFHSGVALVIEYPFSSCVSYEILHNEAYRRPGLNPNVYCARFPAEIIITGTFIT